MKNNLRNKKRSHTDPQPPAKSFLSLSLTRIWLFAEVGATWRWRRSWFSRTLAQDAGRRSTSTAVVVAILLCAPTAARRWQRLLRHAPIVESLSLVLFEFGFYTLVLALFVCLFCSFFSRLSRNTCFASSKLKN